MAGEYVCSVCGKEHAGLPTDWAYKLPDDLWALPEPERQPAMALRHTLDRLPLMS